MVSALTIFAFAATALAATVENPEFTLNVLLKRQESTSGAQYQCHSDCGYTILDASAENCNNSTWTDLLANCEECANTYNILRYYGTQVGAAAEDCGLTATFSPSAGASSASALAETSAAVSSALSSSQSITSTAETSGHSEPSTSEATSSPVAAATTSTSQTSAASGTILPSPSTNNTTNATQSAVPTGLEESTGAGVKFACHGGAVSLAAFLLWQCLL